MQTRSTFKTHTGHRAPHKSYLKFVYVLYLAVKRKYLNQYPEMPWIPFSAISKLNSLIKSDWKVLEIGAGMSTLWLSNRAEKVISIEADLDWYNKLATIISNKKIKNVDLQYKWVAEEMADFSNFPDNYFDLIYIDGGPREWCCNSAKAKIKNGGYIYLDNSDNQSLSENGADVLRAFVNNDQSKIDLFVDFVPGNIMVNEGLLVCV